jgi:hypothetical protein
MWEAKFGGTSCEIGSCGLPASSGYVVYDGGGSLEVEMRVDSDRREGNGCANSKINILVIVARTIFLYTKH